MVAFHTPGATAVHPLLCIAAVSASITSGAAEPASKAPEAIVFINSRRFTVPAFFCYSVCSIIEAEEILARQ
jgi:acyl dehydratase